MKPIITAITGNNELKMRPKEVNENIYKALNDFYTAFNGRNLTLMQKNWLNSQDIVMSNPLGGIKRGWDEINEVYKRIFLAKAVVYVEFYDYTILDMEDGFCAVGRENGFLELDGEKIDLAIRTSRVYRVVDSGYAQVHHHGSIEKPELLKEYQNLLKKGLS